MIFFKAKKPPFSFYLHLSVEEDAVFQPQTVVCDCSQFYYIFEIGDWLLLSCFHITNSREASSLGHALTILVVLPSDDLFYVFLSVQLVHLVSC